ncbi:MAG: 5-formyltetrahydrofolate cyclo-ligase [Pseudomonadota bacterium]|nr:5-formyltetrahydrofolate cyclo-ligase [Pseudomonadota bacterium]
MSLAEQKRRLRPEILARRGLRGGARRAQAALVRAAWLLERKAPTGAVALFAGFGDELDPMPLARRLARQGRQVLLPVVVRRGEPLRFRAWRPGTRMRRAAFGIREPAHRAPAPVPAIVLVPLVGIDNNGTRLGHGGGYYDRTIAGWRAHGRRPLLVGLAFEAQRVARLPRGRHDRRLDMLVSEAATRRFR